MNDSTSGINLYQPNGEPTDLNYILRGLLVVFVLVLATLYIVAHPTPWSPMGEHADQQNQRQQTNSAPADPSERQA